MSKAIQIRLDDDLKVDAESVLDDLGLDFPTAIRMYLKKVVATRSIPFSLEVDNLKISKTEEQEILKAYKESLNEENLSPPLSSIEEVRKSLDYTKSEN